MAITAYTGLMGSGKSYQVVSVVILGAIAQGRRVVTNIDGINNEECRMYVAEKFGKSLDDIGNVIYVSDEEILSPGFFPTKYRRFRDGKEISSTDYARLDADERLECVERGEDMDTVVKGGDLVCVDEAIRFWGTGEKVSQEHKIFWRFHRHFSNSSNGLTCDLVIMTQDVEDLTKALKLVIETTYKTTKLKAVGQEKRYRIEWWSGYSLRQKRAGVEVRSYDPAIFPLYSSYAGGSGKEVDVDGRLNILGRRQFWMLLVFSFSAIFLGVYAGWRFFHPQSSAHVHAMNGEGGKIPPQGSSVAPAFSGSPQSALPPPKLVEPKMSDIWRIVGVMRRGPDVRVVLRSVDGLRFEALRNFQFLDGEPASGLIDGEKVTRFTGPHGGGSPGLGSVGIGK